MTKDLLLEGLPLRDQSIVLRLLSLEPLIPSGLLTLKLLLRRIEFVEPPADFLLSNPSLCIKGLETLDCGESVNVRVEDRIRHCGLEPVEIFLKGCVFLLTH